MDAERFENLLRALSTTPSRRSALGLVASAALGGLLALAAVPSAAKKKGGKGKKGKGKKGKGKKGKGKKGKGGGCRPKCRGLRNCGPDGCGGTCGACNGGGCTAGRCRCLSGHRLCGDTCVNITSDGNNCGACGRKCPAGCVRGACACTNDDECPDTCTLKCQPQIDGGPSACQSDPSIKQCQTNLGCDLGSICAADGYCKTPC